MEVTSDNGHIKNPGEKWTLVSCTTQGVFLCLTYACDQYTLTDFYEPAFGRHLFRAVDEIKSNPQPSFWARLWTRITTCLS